MMKLYSLKNIADDNYNVIAVNFIQKNINFIQKKPVNDGLSGE
jgi:hypothetical protein